MNSGSSEHNKGAFPSHISVTARTASESDHPLQSSSRSNMADQKHQSIIRPKTFAGKDSSEDYFQHVRGSIEVSEPMASSSWAHPKAMKSYDLGVGDPPNRAGSVPPRMSVLRAVSTSGLPSVGTGYEGHSTATPDIEAEIGAQTWRANAVGSTALDRTIDAIGMGRYQYAVLVLSGFGWAADNMWLQGIAIILPRVQDEWQISNQWIGLVSSCTFAGMMVGALAWGSYSDTFGRKNAFNITLLITSIFGMLSAFSPNFPSLCLCLFLLGTGVGGSMPTDGTIFLEALPKRSHYLLTALSVFFAAGSVISSILGLLIIPHNSCGGAPICNVANNKGWRWLLTSLGLFTMFFVVSRLVFFRLFESPKFLVSAGRHEEARSVLQRIAAYNGTPQKVRLSDVNDQEEHTNTIKAKRGIRASLSRFKPRSWIGNRSASMDWQGQGEERQRLIAEGEGRESVEEQRPAVASAGSPRRSILPTSWKSSLAEARKRYDELFSPQWFKTTILVWSIWTIFTLAYTMVNIFLPKYLQERSGHTQSLQVDADADTRRHNMEAVMQEFLLYSLASLPGSILGAYLVETPLGRIKSMAISTAFLALALLSFAFAATPLAVIVSSCSISLFASVAYAVIYSYPPEVFETSLRGTAGGTASALSRFAGMLAPLLAGLLMSINVNMPLYLGFGLFAFTVWLELSLPIETRQSSHTQASSPSPS